MAGDKKGKERCHLFVETLAKNLNESLIIQVLDILIIWFVVYKLIMYSRGTQMMNLLKGVFVFILTKSLTSFLGLQTLDWLLDQILNSAVVALIVLFQPELRRALQVIGQNIFRNRRSHKNPSVRLIEDLEYALKYMSRRKIGALIAIEQSDELAEYIETGIALDSKITNQLLINIFVPNTPLHDGAVVIKNYRIAAASCFLPLSENDQISKDLGTRHRAAIGLSEVTDALTLIVSEETGGISITHNNTLYRELSNQELKEKLEEYLMVDEEDQDKDVFRMVKDYLVDTFTSRGDE